jgi:TonB family protein
MRMLILAAVLGTTVLAQQSDEKVYKVGDPGVTTPVLTHDVKPNYTGDAMRRKVSGTIVLAAVVKTDGTVRDDVQVIEPLDPDLDAEAVKVVKLWTFKPGTKDDKPVNVSVRIELTFTYR